MTDETVLVAKPFDIAEYLTDNETIEAFLSEMLGNGDPRYLAEALGAIARARGGMTELSRKTGITREALYRALSATGNPELGTILKVMQALGIRLTASIEAKANDKLDNLLAQCDPQAEMTEEDRVWLNLAPTGKEI
jgi:probable addiction module antidote protein